MQLSPKRKALLVTELIVLYVALPLLYWAERRTLGPWLIPSLLLIGGFCTLRLLRDPDFERSRLWKADALVPGMRSALRKFFLGSLLVAALTMLLRPDLVLAFPLSKPWVWVAILLLYPLLSAYPQEIIFRTYFFHRYRPLIPTRWQVVLSATLFGFAHLLLTNWVAVGLSTVGGVLFATTYKRTSSTLLAGLEHGLWGNFLFTLGLGRFFYAGG